MFLKRGEFLLVSLNYIYTINVFKRRRVSSVKFKLYLHYVFKSRQVSFGKFTQVKLILQRVWWIRPSVRGGHRFCFSGTAPEIPKINIVT